MRAGLVFCLAFGLIFIFSSGLIAKINVVENENSVKFTLLIDSELTKIEDLLNLSDLNQFTTLKTSNPYELIFNFAIPSKNYKISFLEIIESEGIDYQIPENYSIPNLFFTDDSYISKSRNIEILSLPISLVKFDYQNKTFKYLKKIEFTIEFTNLLQIKEPISNEHFNESYYFKDIINQKHLISLINGNCQNNNLDNNKLLNKSWYDNSIKYVKLLTDKDAIYTFEIKDISTLMPEIIGKPSNYIHLLSNGTEIPIYLMSDDVVISDDDKIIFLGQRAKGDTTWYDNYTDYHPFFLYYDDSNVGLRFSSFNSLNSELLPFSESFDFFQHIEEEKFYGIGTEFTSILYDGSLEKSNYNDSRTVQSEAWYWSQISPKGFAGIHNRDIFTNQLTLFPSDKDEDSFEVSLKYVTNQDSIYRGMFLPDVTTIFDLRYSVNNSLQQRDSLRGYKSSYLKSRSNFKGFLPGLNNIQVESKSVYPETNERTNIDYIEIKGKKKPIADKDFLAFNGKSNFKTIASGFLSSEIVVIDTTASKLHIQSSSKRGYQFASGALLNDNLITVTNSISDFRIYSDKYGVHVIDYNSSSKNFNYKHFVGTNNDHNNYINSIPNGSPVSIIVVMQQGSINLSSLKQLGSKLSDSYTSGKIYSGFFIKSLTQAIENIKENTSSSISFIEDQNGINYSFELALESQSNSSYLIHGINNLEKVNKIELVNSTSIKQLEGKVDGVIISHAEFIEKAKILAEYRRNTQGLKIEVVDVEDVYKEYNYGKKSPHAIKSYLTDYYVRNNLKYALLVGDASWDARKKLPNSLSTDWIPTYGYPASDWWYTFLDGDDDFRADITIGRLPVNTNDQLQNYIDKVIEYDNLPIYEWMKRFLFLIGGYTRDEINKFNNLITSHYRDELLLPDLCAEIDRVVKDATDVSTSAQGGIIREKINSGNIWTIYIGHAAAEIFDLDGWNAGSLNNKGRYSILTTISCNTGAFAEPELIASRNEQYILEKDKGFVAATGASFTGFVGTHNNIASRMIYALSRKDFQMRNIGDLLMYGKANLYMSYPESMITLYTFSLLGDPMLKVRIGEESDAYINESDVNIANQDGNNIFTVNDQQAVIRGKVHNYGYSINEPFNVTVRSDYNAQAETKIIPFSNLCKNEEFQFVFDISNKPGRHKFTITIDPDIKINELSKSNNTIVKYIDVFESGLIPLDPMPYWNVSQSDPTFRVINPIFSRNHEWAYQFLITSSKDTINTIISADTRTGDNNIIPNDLYIDWKPDYSLMSNTSYWLHTRYINISDNTWSNWLSIPINVSDEILDNNVNLKLQSQFEFESGKFDNVSMSINNESKVNLIIKTDSINFHSLSVKGNLPDNKEGNPVVDPYVNVEIGDKVFLDGPHDLGFNVVTFKKKNGQIITKQKRFETWGLNVDYPAEENFEQSDSPIKLVEFLRDSIENDEYLFIATCKSSFRLPLMYKLYGKDGNHGSIDSVFYYLKQFGSRIADTLKIDENQNGEQISFTMMGWRGAEVGSIPESISFVGDSAYISGSLNLISDSGKYTSPFIGPAKKWKSIDVDANYKSLSNVVMSVNLIELETNNVTTVKTTYNPTLVDLSDIDGSKYMIRDIDFNYSIVSSDLQSLNSEEQSSISSLKLVFEPLTELALNSYELKYEKDGSLKGYPVTLKTKIHNLSVRSNSDSTDLRINILKSGTANDYRFIPVSLQKNQTKDIDYLISTDFLDYINTVRLDINSNDNVKEYYKFNNTINSELLINKDTTKPFVKLIIDEKEHKNNDYISVLPTITVELYDNSPLKINDSTKITVRVNGFLHPYQRTLWSEFKSIDNSGNLKATFSFKPDSLQYEDVSIIVYFADNEGNRDTLNTFAKVSLVNASIEDVFTFPNPANQELNFSLNYKAPLPGAKATFRIFDLSGMSVAIIEKPLILGINNINWNGLSNSFKKLADGVYFFRVDVESEYYVEPMYGKFIILNQ